LSPGGKCESKKGVVEILSTEAQAALQLMPELYEHLNPMPFEAAVQMELELAEELRAAGYTVTGGH
jgi:hypothetical protein